MKQLLAIIVGGVLAVSGPAVAGMAMSAASSGAAPSVTGPSVTAPSGTAPSGGAWAVGGLAFGMPVSALPEGALPGGAPPKAIPGSLRLPERAGGLPGQVAPIRLSHGFTLTSLGENVQMRPWAAVSTGPDGGRQSVGGVLMDIPVGSFTFTPSVGLGREEPVTLSGRSALTLRSQLELTYRFDNASNLSLALSRRATVGNLSATPEESDMIGLTYRLPFVSLWPW